LLSGKENRCPDDSFNVYDTTLRDGAQQEGLHLTVADKLAIAARLDELGVGFTEGGWPGAIPRDTEFFRLAPTDLELKHAQLAAFGATRRPRGHGRGRVCGRPIPDPVPGPVAASSGPQDRPAARARAGHPGQPVAPAPS
jgi:hypothetical protein